jgi:hypothetical protein
LRKEWKWSLAFNREKTLPLEPILELKELTLQLTFTILQKSRDDDLEPSGLGIHVRTAMNPHRDPLGGLKCQGSGRTSPHDARELSPLIFHRKVEVPTRGDGELRDLPMKKKLRKMSFKGIVDLTSSLGNRKVWVT